MQEYFTTGQVAQQLRISVSTLKRWVAQGSVIPRETRNATGWMLFSQDDLDNLKQFKKDKRKNGKHFTEKTLRPIS
jgi:DNA-binding transcriptional MerR regulator